VKGGADVAYEAMQGDEERGLYMVVSNFDKPFEGCVNTKFDAPYTLSVIDLDQ